MRSIIFSLLLIISISLCAAPLKLAENGKTNYTIVLSSNASAIDKLAAKELAFFLKEITGINYQISTTQKSPAIFIGNNKSTKLANDVNVVETIGKDLYLYGGGIHGNLWAVYEFLENHYYNSKNGIAPGASSSGQNEKHICFKDRYTKETLLGKHVAVLCNLKPSKLRDVNKSDKIS